MVEFAALPREPIEGRLRARPMPDPAGLVTAGLHELALAGGTRSLLYVPELDAGGSPLPLVTMLHGSGAGAEQSLDLVREEAEARRVVVLAPKSRGYTWDLLVGGLGPDVEALDESLAQVFVRCPVDPAHVGIGGFSDGASYALSIGLANGDLFSHVLAFSPGFSAPPMVVGSPRIFVCHGTDDRVLRIGRTSRRLVPQLEGAGYEVAYQEFDGGHTVPPALVRRALASLAGS